MAKRRIPGISVYLDEQTKTRLQQIGWKRFRDRKLATILKKIVEAELAADEEAARGSPRPTPRSHRQVGKA